MSAARRKGTSTPGFEDLVREDLKTGKFRPVYVLSGEDTLRKEGVVEHLKKTVLGEAGAAFNFHVYNADESTLGPILQQALSYPMLGSHQVIWAKNIDAAVGRRGRPGQIGRIYSKTGRRNGSDPDGGQGRQAQEMGQEGQLKAATFLISRRRRAKRWYSGS